eukprot:CAMPEP_0185035738 /NCGR_PEP_ID=MMETSP1103-20130426/27644_1 /TAXON_ID=36769 /ORGANISM="Paraphysomonas bandaiensis, Strain Caron Lab Isolate" /LENGTH=350 /DNA_ID=CAMNT_0027572975 /DNA_START=89 /DNA_END=1138 /DNA_ORIENTATION=+
MSLYAFYLLLSLIHTSHIHLSDSVTVSYSLLYKNVSESNRRARVSTDHLFCLQPASGTLSTYGGFGNLMMGVNAVQALALVSGSIPVINHAMFLAMFSHPNPKESYDVFKPSQIRLGSVRRIYCQSSKFFRSKLSKLGRSGVNVLCNKDAYMHRESIAFFSTALSISPTDARYYDMASSSVAHWMLSNPTAYFESIVRRHRDKVLHRCGGTQSRLDVAVQIRTWADVPERREQFFTQIPCVMRCIMNLVRFVASGKGVHIDTYDPDSGEAPLCIFVTTDNSTVTNDIVEYLEGISTAIRATSSTSISPEYLNFTAPRTHVSHWHSAHTIKSSQHEFSASELDSHIELLDW